MFSIQSSLTADECILVDIDSLNTIFNNVVLLRFRVISIVERSLVERDRLKMTISHHCAGALHYLIKHRVESGDTAGWIGDDDMPLLCSSA